MRPSDSYGKTRTSFSAHVTSRPAHIQERSWSSYWFNLFCIDEVALRCTRDAFSDALRAEGIRQRRGYVPELLYEAPMFQNRCAYPGSDCPFGLSDARYDRGMCPNAELVRKTSIKLPMSEFFTESDVDEVTAGIGKLCGYFRSRRGS